MISEGCQALFVSNLQSVDFSRFSKYQPPVVCVWFMAPLITVKVSLFVLLLESNNCQHHQHGFPLSQNKHYLPLSLLPLGVVRTIRNIFTGDIECQQTDLQGGGGGGGQHAGVKQYQQEGVRRCWDLNWLEIDWSADSPNPNTLLLTPSTSRLAVILPQS